MPRPKEKNGKDYFFVSKNYFKKLIKKKEFIEHAKVFDNYYGSSKRLIIEKLKQGKNIVFDIDWQGTRQIKNKKLNYKLVTIFILPPSKNEKTVTKRMKEFKKDLSRWKEYDYVVINDNLQKCYENIMKIIKRKNKIVFDKNYINAHVKGLLN